MIPDCWGFNVPTAAVLLTSGPMAARICPRCSTRVDERRARTSPFCLSCGAPLGAPSPTFGGKPAPTGSALPWILGGVALVFLLGLAGIVAVVAIVANAAPEPAPVVTPPVLPPLVQAPVVPDAGIDASPAVAKTAPTVRITSPQPTSTPTLTIRPPPTVTIPIPQPTATPTTDVATGPFPRARAQSEVDRVSQGLGSCKSSSGPFGLGSIRVDFEPDGRVTTTTRAPFGGTTVGTCISARFRAIKIGKFIGSTSSIDKSFIIQDTAETSR